MATIVVDEYIDETEAMDVEDNRYRAKLINGKTVEITFNKYIDAERAGYCGYMGKEVCLPASIIKQIAEDLNGSRL